MSKRIPRINKLIKQEVSKILFREVDFPKDVLVTVTRVEATPNLIEAKVWISVLPENKKNNVMEILNRQIYNIQQKINRLLQMRPLPKLRFVEEKEIQEADKIEELLEKIKNE